MDIKDQISSEANFMSSETNLIFQDSLWFHFSKKPASLQTKNKMSQSRSSAKLLWLQDGSVENTVLCEDGNKGNGVCYHHTVLHLNRDGRKQRKGGKLSIHFGEKESELPAPIWRTYDPISRKQ